MKLQKRDYKILYQIVLAFIFCLLNISASAQYQQLYFDHINIKDGLSQSTVNRIIQDKNGYLWFATFYGLNKFDGYTFKVYRKDPNNKNSISSNDINDILEDRNGYIWILNDNAGLDRYDPKSETFVNFSYNVNDPNSLSSNDLFSIMQDSKGRLWVCAGEYLNLIVNPGEVDKIRFEKYKYPGSKAMVNYIFENRDNQLLVFSDNLYYFDELKKVFIKTDVSLNNIQPLSIVEDKKGNLLVGTSLNGIFKLEYNEVSKSYKSVDPGKINVTPIGRNYLFADSKNHIWIGTVLNGLYQYDQESDELYHYMPDELDNKSLNDNTIYSIYEDNTGVLWIGTFSQGLNKLNFYSKRFLHYRKLPFKKNTLSGNVVSSIHSLTKDELWVGLDVGGGINRILFSNSGEAKIVHYHYEEDKPDSETNNSTLCLVQRRNKEVWAGCAGGVVVRLKPDYPCTGKTPEMKKYYFDRWTFVIFEDSDGVLWGGTWDNGLWRYNDKLDKFDFWAPDPNNIFSIGDKVIWAIGEDQHKNIWVGGHGNGISIITADEKRKVSPRFIKIQSNEKDSTSLSNNTINAFCQAKDGAFWVCTAGGLSKVVNYNDITGTFKDFPKIKFKSYHTANGLPAESIVGIVEDNSANIWLSTSNGLAKLNPHTEAIVTYNEDQGLQSNEFWHNAYFKNSDGMIFFGGKNGFNAFYPENITVNPFKPKVLLSNLHLFNNPVNVGDTINGQVILKESLDEIKTINLNYKNNFITFQYAAIHYAQPNLVQYAYYLDGFEEDWNYVGNRRTATYTNLNPGYYTFRVKATNNDGIWSDKEIALPITVTPPWRKSLVVKIAMPLLIILLVYLFIRVRLGMLRKQKKVLERLVENRTEELQQVNALLEERQEEVLIQNEELMRHRNDLEGMVMERTRELEKAKQKAEESDKLKSSFLANMSHEIRTPMNAILGFSSLLNNIDFTVEEKDGFVRSIQSNGESLMILINDILDISMIESNQLILYPQYLNVNEVLAELENYYRLKNESGLEIEFVKNHPDDLIMFIDPVRFRQIMNNLINNAIKFTSEGFVRFGYEKRENEICFFVSDSGIGIDEEHSKMIFNHFYKVELQADSKIYRGTGIGLAICKRLVELLKGKIWLESQLCVGSNFYFTLPYQDAGDKRVIANKQSSGPKMNLDDIFYVIAEDEPANYEVLVRMMHILDSKHFWGKNGKDVVDYIEKLNNRDNIIVLMDIKMPVMNGYDAMKMIKAIDKNIPVIAITAFALKHEEKEILEQGFDYYIAKPIIAKKLRDLLNKIISERGMNS